MDPCEGSEMFLVHCGGAGLALSTWFQFLQKLIKHYSCSVIWKLFVCVYIYAHTHKHTHKPWGKIDSIMINKRHVSPHWVVRVQRKPDKEGPPHQLCKPLQTLQSRAKRRGLDPVEWNLITARICIPGLWECIVPWLRDKIAIGPVSCNLNSYATGQLCITYNLKRVIYLSTFKSSPGMFATFWGTEVISVIKVVHVEHRHEPWWEVSDGNFKKPVV